MTTTLKKRHTEVQLQSLRKKLLLAEQNLSVENKLNEEFKLIVEEMNEKDLQNVSGVIQKLRTLQSMAKDSGALGDAIDKALMDLQKITGTEKTLGQKFLGLVNQGDNAKILKNAMGLVSALETGFRLMPQLIKNMIGPMSGNSQDVNKTVADLLMGENRLREAPGEPTIETKPVDNKTASNLSKGSEKVELLTKNITQAMIPSKWLGLATGKIPYIDDPNALVTDILNSVPVGSLMKIVKTVTGGPQASNLAQNIAGSGQGGETQKTQGTQGTAVTKGSKEMGTSGTTPAGEPIAQTANSNVSKQWLDSFSNYIEKQTGVDRDSINKIMSVLVKNNKLHEGNTLSTMSTLETLEKLSKTKSLVKEIKLGNVKLHVKK